MSHKDNALVGVKEAILECYLGILCLVAFLAVQLTHGSAVVSGGLLLLAAIAAMLGFAKADLMIIGRPRTWLREHKSLIRFLHKTTDEGEYAGIAVGVIALGAVFISTGHFLIHASVVYNCLALLGILAAARIAAPHTQPILRALEYVGGLWLVLVGGGLMASLMGPAASVVLVKYLEERVRSDKRAELAVKLAAVIGSGNGILPYVAPPVIIVWGVLQTSFGWGLGTYLALVGLPCFIYVLFTSRGALSLMKEEARYPILKPFGFSDKMALPLLHLGIMITAHIAISENILLALVDAATGIANYFISRSRFPRHDNLPHKVLEDRTKAKWEPIVLAALLAALDVIGTVGAPFVSWAAGFIPLDLPTLAVAALFFLVAAPASGYADNALITKVFAALVVPLIANGKLSMAAATIIIIAIMLAALFGGTLTPPGNIPNFPIRAALQVESSAWRRAAIPLMLRTVIVYVLWIIAMSIVLR